MIRKGASIPALGDGEVTRFCQAIGLAPRAMGRGAEEFVKRYDLGRRGVWIMGLISVGIDSPSGLSDALCIRRSLLSAELARLAKAGLVSSEKDSSDGRRLRIELTREGKAANSRLQKSLNKFVNENLAGFSKEDVLLCSRVLLAFAGSDAGRLGPAPKG